MTTVPDAPMRVGGHVDPAFTRVADVFADNLERGLDLGAAVAVYVNGRNVVDLWGGVARRGTGAPWLRDTLAVVFSASKGVVAICAHVLVSRGRLDLDEPVAVYWPEFAQAGKSEVTVRDLLSHRAGLPLVEGDLTLAEIAAWTPVIRDLERQAPLWPPGSGHGYHALTYGWLVGEVIRRVTGLTPGQFLAAEIARPHGLDLWLGLPVDQHHRTVHLEPPLAPFEVPLDPPAFVRDALRAVTLNDQLPFPGLEPRHVWNDPSFLTAEVPAGNLAATARDLARLYAMTVATGAGDALLAPDVLADAVIERSTGAPVFGMAASEERWASGFALGSAATPMLGPASFGHGGAGGQVAFADLEHRIGFAYVNNRMGGLGDGRARSLVGALNACLGVRSP
jgi:CubicO group peptidase (beta-lactamase class C family)